MKYLLDSNVIAAALNGRLPVVLRLSQLKPGEVAVSVVAKLETERALRREPRLQSRFGKLLKEFLAAVPVLDINSAVAQQAANIAAFLGPAEKISAFDLLTAATAAEHQLTLVTDRPRVFAAVSGLEVETWR